jgi:hypothetical protein
MHQYQHGDRVRAVVPLGLIDPDGSRFRFTGTAQPGDLGTVVPRLDPRDAPDFWLIVEFDDHPGMFGPVAPEHIEPA